MNCITVKKYIIVAAPWHWTINYRRAQWLIRVHVQYTYFRLQSTVSGFYVLQNLVKLSPLSWFKQLTFITFQCLPRRRISSYQLAPKSTVENNIDDLYINELLMSNHRPRSAFGDRLETEMKAAECYSQDNIQMKALGLTSDDYIEQRIPEALNRYPYTCMNSLDFSQYNNDVSTVCLSYKMWTKYEWGIEILEYHISIVAFLEYYQFM